MAPNSIGLQTVHVSNSTCPELKWLNFPPKTFLLLNLFLSTAPLCSQSPNHMTSWDPPFFTQPTYPIYCRTPLVLLSRCRLYMSLLSAHTSTPPVQALITSWSYNSLIQIPLSLNQFSTQAARAIFPKPKSDQTVLLLNKPQWLPITSMIQYKILCLVIKALYNLARLIP